jgi:hypothetical protein
MFCAFHSKPSVHSCAELKSTQYDFRPKIRNTILFGIEDHQIQSERSATITMNTQIPSDLKDSTTKANNKDSRTISIIEGNTARPGKSPKGYGLGCGK